MRRVNRSKERLSEVYRTPTIILSHLIIAVIAFQFGFLAGNNDTEFGLTATSTGSTSFRRLEPVEYAMNASSSSTTPKHEETSHCSGWKHAPGKQFHDSMSSFLSGAVRVDRAEFSKLVDVGTPTRELRRGNNDLLLLYASRSSLPHRYEQKTRIELMPLYAADEALRNCDVVKVMLTNPGERKTCIAISGEYDSNAVYKFMRLPEDFAPTKKWGGPAITSPNHTLQLVGNTQRDNGNAMVLPRRLFRNNNFRLLADYLTKLPATEARLAPLARKAAGSGKVVTVMVCNRGQSTLLFNFVCSARAANIDTSSILLFATDEAVAELGRNLGLNVFEVQDSFGPLPVNAARAYGDQDFAQMMLAKIYCVQLVNHLGHDVLFQDVDVVWQRNPLELFERELVLGGHDVLAQDDGSRAIRFSPYAVNTGFYYIRHNQRTENFLSALVRSGDCVMEDGSHQSVMIALLREHASRHGLKIKVFDRDSDQGRLIPGGFHFHRRPDLMRAIMNGTNVPYAFHMSWTINHNAKRLFFEQLGYWYISPTCLDENHQPTRYNNSTFGSWVLAEHPMDDACCVARPEPTCHYRDKPSKTPCTESPRIDKGGSSFW
jgi:Nucleotide-diphospho-sugar transferase